MNSAATANTDKKSPEKGVVQHHEIGELAHFLSVFGKSKDDAVKSLMTSSLQILGLDEVRLKFGDKWKVIERRVDFAVEAFFSKKLGKKDLFLRLGTGNYALIFANTSSEEGLDRANKLAKELLHLLFGEVPEVEKIEIQAMAIDIDLGDVIDEFQNIEELIEYLQGYNSDTREEDEQKFREVEADLSICFRPMINHSKKMMSVIEAMPCRLDHGKWAVIPLTDPLIKGTADLRAELDFKIVRETDTALKRLGSMRNKPVVMVSVEYETLAHAYRRLKYAELIKKLPAYTQKHLIINIIGVGEGLLNSRLRQILTTIKPLVLGFTFEVSDKWDDFEVISDLPVYGVSAVGNTEQDLVWIEKLFKKAKSVGVRSCWRNLDSDEMARRAFGVGTDYVSGPVIGGCQLDPIAPFSLKGALKPKGA